jgi:ribosomal protein S18 acetylase RimI-like enzyme
MLTGSCLCRAVRFEIRGELGAIVHCHCVSCRKAQGGAFATNAPVSRDAFALVAGAEHVERYESSPGQFRCFCRRCGSPVFSYRDSIPDTVRIRLGTLDTDPGARPVLHSWTGEKAPWFRITDDLPRFRAGDPGSVEPALAIAAESVASDDSRALIDRLDAELGERYPRAAIHGLHAADLVDERLVFLVARLDGRAVGCGALRPLGPAVAEVKRMFVVPDHRGQGVARRLLRALEAAALARGWTTVRLETGVRQPESIALYRSAGYREIPRFGEYAENPFSACFEKPLDAAPAAAQR